MVGSRAFYKLKPEEICNKITESYHKSMCSLKGISFEIHEHVYPSQEFRSSRLLLECVQELATNQTICDMGCGMGVVGIFALHAQAKQVVQADINPYAIENARANKNLHGLSDQKLRIYESDCFDTIPLQKFDLIIFNIPFHSEEHKFNDPLERAFYDPHFQTLKKFLLQSHSYMDENSQIMIAFSNKGDVAELERLFTFYQYNWTLWRLINTDQQFDSRIYLLKKQTSLNISTKG